MLEPQVDSEELHETAATASPGLPLDAWEAIRREVSTLEAELRCRRCRGLLVRDVFWSQGLRCVNCGEVVDALIVKHRLFGYVPSRTRARR